MRVVFFGTPEFAVPSLAKLLDAGLEIPLVVTQPDRPVGRHAEVTPSPVARFGQSRGIAVARPPRLAGNTEFLEQLTRLSPDAAAVVAYGRMLPREVLELPRLGCVNVHASLLPRHRGASPVQAAILAGDAETGVVTMRIVEPLDAGPLYLSRRVPIGKNEDAATLSRRLSELGAELLAETLAGLEAGTLVARSQEGEPTYSRPVRREEGEADWSRPAGELARRLRAFTPWPGLFTFLGAERVKILAAVPVAGTPGRAPGEFRPEGETLLVAAGEESALSITRLQREGRQPVSGGAFARGAGEIGRFGPTPRR